MNQLMMVQNECNFQTQLGSLTTNVAEGEQQPKTPVDMAPQAMVSSGPSSAAVGSQLDVPQTPDISQAVPATPRTNLYRKKSVLKRTCQYMQRLDSSVVEHQSCNLKLLGSILSGN